MQNILASIRKNRAERKPKGGNMAISLPFSLTKKPTYYPAKPFDTLRDALRASERQYSERPAFLQKEKGSWRAYTYAEFLDLTEGLGTELYAQGMGGGTFLVIGENSMEWGCAYLATAGGLGVVVPIDSEIPEEEFRMITGECQPTAIFYSEKQKAKAEWLPPEVRRICFTEIAGLAESGQRRIYDGDTRYVNLKIDSEALAVLLYTSGTTGRPKGVMLSQKNICSNISDIATMLWHEPDDIFFAVLPFHHAYPCTTSLLFPLCRGCCVAICQGLRYITRDLQEVKPTIILGVPILIETVYRKIMINIRRKGPKTEKLVSVLVKLTGNNMALKRRVFAEIHDSLGGRVRLIISGGAAADPAVLKGLHGFGFLAIQGYGLTECAPLAAVNKDDAFKFESAGLPTPHGVLDIYDVKSDGTGEIRYKGDNVMLGYYKNPEATAEVLRDGWFYTGDIGYIDRDGFLYITGRKKNLIVTLGGKNVSPEELEDHLCRNSFVAEAVVVAYMNETKGDYDIVAVMYPDTETFTEVYGPRYTSGQIEAEFAKAVAEVNASVQSFKHISYFVIRKEEFSKTTTKKIKRKGVAEESKDEYLRKLAGMN